MRRHLYATADAREDGRRLARAMLHRTAPGDEGADTTNASRDPQVSARTEGRAHCPRAQLLGFGNAVTDFAPRVASRRDGRQKAFAASDGSAPSVCGQCRSLSVANRNRHAAPTREQAGTTGRREDPGRTHSTEPSARITKKTNVTWVNANASYVNIPRPNAATEATNATSSQPSTVRSCRACRPTSRMNRVKSHTSESTPTSPTFSRLKSHWLSRMRAFASGPGRLQCSVPIPEERLFAEKRECMRSEVCDPTRSNHEFVARLLGDQAPGGRKRELHEPPGPPGTTKWTMTTIGMSRGARRQVSRNLSTRKTRPATDQHKHRGPGDGREGSRHEDHHSDPPPPEPNRSARYSASGATIAKSPPSAMGCSADPSARTAPPLFPREEGRLLQQGDELVEMLERRPSRSRLDHCQPRENSRPRDENASGWSAPARTSGQHSSRSRTQRQRSTPGSARGSRSSPYSSRHTGVGKITRYESDGVYEHRPLKTTSAKRNIGLSEERRASRGRPQARR